jgi:hypothetical protein
MTGTWRWTVGFGVFGALLTFLFQVSSNTIGTTLLRTLYAFLAYAALSLAVRYVLGILLRPAATARPALPEDERGAVIDLTTPDDGGGLTDLMKDQGADGKDRPVAGFQPLKPEKLVSLDHPKTEDVVHAVRRLTDE